MPSFRGAFFAEKFLFSWLSIAEGFLAESIPVPTGTRNDGKIYFFRSLFSLLGFRAVQKYSTPKPAVQSSAEAGLVWKSDGVRIAVRAKSRQAEACPTCARPNRTALSILRNRNSAERSILAGSARGQRPA